MKTSVKCLIVLLLFMLLKYGQTQGTNHCVNQGLNEDIKRVEAVVGRDVILPCVSKPPFNAAHDILVWSKGDSEIYTIRDGKPFSRYKSRASVPIEEFKKGDVSLKLFHVMESDEGQYCCCIYRNDERECTAVNLIISEEDKKKKEESKKNKAQTQTTETPLDSGGGPGDIMNNKGLIIGLIVSVVLNLVLAAGVCIYCYKTTASKPRFHPACEVPSLSN